MHDDNDSDYLNLLNLSTKLSCISLESLTSSFGESHLFLMSSLLWCANLDVIGDPDCMFVRDVFNIKCYLSWLSRFLGVVDAIPGWLTHFRGW